MNKFAPAPRHGTNPKFAVIIINERATLTAEIRYSETASRLELSRCIFLQTKRQEVLPFQSHELF